MARLGISASDVSLMTVAVEEAELVVEVDVSAFENDERAVAELDSVDVNGTDGDELGASDWEGTDDEGLIGEVD